MTFDTRSEQRAGFAVYLAEQIRAAVGFIDLIEPVKVAFREFSGGCAQQTMSILWPAERPEDGDVLIKSGCIGGHDVFVVKTAPWFRTNQAAGEPQGGLVSVFDSTTGYPLAVLLDEHYLSDIRTAAAGAVTADLLAPPGTTTAGVLGTGAQAYWQALALAHVRPLETIRIWGRNTTRAADLAERLAWKLPTVSLTTVPVPEQAVHGSDVVITATAATEPLLQASWLQDGQHLLSVGADTPGKCELAPAVLERADLVVVDSRETATSHGNPRRALAEGALNTTDLTELGQLLDTGYLRPANDITVASLVGIGVQDVVAAEHALTLLNSTGSPSFAIYPDASQPRS